MKPTYWRLHWRNPLTGEHGTADYAQRHLARGALMMQNAQGMQVQLVPVFS